jgi:hypothetical protein
MTKVLIKGNETASSEFEGILSCDYERKKTSRRISGAAKQCGREDRTQLQDISEAPEAALAGSR